MPVIYVFSLAFLVLLGAQTRVAADDQATALALLDQAIRAHGGEQQLAKAQVVSSNVKGIMILFGKEMPFTAELTSELPHRFRMVLNLDPNDQKIQMTLVLNEDRGWRATGGTVAELAKEELDDLREERYVTWLASLLPLRDKAFSLAPLPEIQVNGQPALGIKVSRTGHGEAKLYFDKRSHLLVKVERRGREAGLSVEKEYLHFDHKNFEGVVLATKYIELTSGKKFAEVTTTSYRFPRRVEAQTFAKP
jgi:hypothetical protein